MCLYIFAYKSHSKYPLILAGNRDEFYDRPTAPLNFWKDHPHVLGGRDLEQNGTWLGMTRQGRIAALTNYRDGTRPKRTGLSRGLLVSDFLTGNDAPQAYLEKLMTDKTNYPGFNLLVGDTNDLWYFSNRCHGIQKLMPGVHGLSNHLLNTAWPKLARARSAVRSIIRKRSAVHINDYIQILTDQTIAPDKALPQTGVELDLERLLSSIYVASPTYGTRSSSVILIDIRGRITFFEQTWQAAQALPQPAGHQCFRFALE